MTPPDDGAIDDREIDLLVDGELNPASRRDLLARLESSPDGWRRCALAFLEAQAFRGAVASVAREAPIAPIVARPPQARRVWPWLARAAVMLLAFGLGWAVHGAGGGPPPMVRTIVPPAPIAKTPPASPRPSPSLAGLPRERRPSIDYVRGHLEREGYRVEQRILLVPAATKDGRRVAVPVEQRKLRFVGNRAV